MIDLALRAGPLVSLSVVGRVRIGHKDTKSELIIINDNFLDQDFASYNMDRYILISCEEPA